MTDTLVIGTLITSTQSNITSVGILNNLQVNGTTTLSNFVSSSIDSSTFKITENSISIGNQAGLTSQRTNTIAIGYQAGYTNQGTNSIAIGFLAGMTNQPRNSIVINASDTGINASTADSTFIAPVRNVSQTNVLGYNILSREITYYSSAVLTSTLEQMSFFRLSSTQSVPNSTDYVIKYDTTVVNNITDLSHNTSTGIFTLGSPGMYNITYVNRWDTATGDKIGWVLWSVYSGVYFARSWINSAGGTTVVNSTVSFVAYNTNTTVQVVCNQNSGSAQNLQGEAQIPGQGTYVLITRVY